MISFSCRKIFIQCFLLVFLCVVLISCTRKSETDLESPQTIRIGMIITTGEERMEKTEYSVFDMVSSRIKDAGGIEVDGKKLPLKIVLRKIDGRVPEQAVRAVKELINQESVVAIVGPSFSQDAIPAGEVAEQSGIPLIAPVSIHPDTTAHRKYVFRAAFLDEFQAQSMARFCLRDIGVKRAAVFYNTANPYSRVLAEMFRDTVNREGGKVLSFESYITGETDFTAQLGRIREGSPEVLYLPNYFDEAAPIALEAREMGIDAIFLGVASWDMEKAKKMSLFEGAYIVDYVSLEVMKGESRAFVEEYISRYHRYPQSGTILTYDSFGILFAAIRHARSSKPDAIRGALYDLGPYEGVAGKIDFSDSGDPEREAVIVRFVNGELRFQKRIQPRGLVGETGS